MQTLIIRSLGLQSGLNNTQVIIHREKYFGLSKTNVRILERINGNLEVFVLRLLDFFNIFLTVTYHVLLCRIIKIIIDTNCIYKAVSLLMNHYFLNQLFGFNHFLCFFQPMSKQKQGIFYSDNFFSLTV